MNIRLYNCNCEINRYNKEPFLSNMIEVEAYQRTPVFDKINPSIYIELKETFIGVVSSDNDDLIIGENDEVGFITNLERPNYCYIEEFERYYFITSHTYQNNKILIMQLELDPYMSFKTKEWVNKPLYITRRTKGNSFICDNTIQFKYEKKITTNNSETISDTEAVSMGYQTFGIAYGNYSVYRDMYCVVVAVSNPLVVQIYEEQNQNFIPSRRENGSGRMNYASSNMSFSHRNTTYYVITPRMLNVFCSYVLQNSSVLGYILSVTILPYSVRTENTYEGSVINFFPSGHIDFSSEGFTTYSVKNAKYGNNDRFLYRTIQMPNATSYRDYEPYTEAYLYIPYADTIKLNLQSTMGCKLRLYYYVDYDTSNSTYILYNVTRDVIEATGSCQLGYKFTLTSSNAEEIRKTQENNLTTFLFGALTSGLSLASGNPLGMIATSKGLINSMSQYITRENAIIPKANASATSSNTGSMLPLEPYITWNISDMTMNDTSYQNYVKNIGLPFNDYEYLSNIEDNEHVIVGDVSDIDMSSDMTNNELILLKNALSQGFYK